MKTEVILSALEAKHPGEKEYLQAVKEVLLSIEEVYNQHPEFEKAKIIERLVFAYWRLMFCFCMKRESGLEVSCGLSCRVL